MKYTLVCDSEEINWPKNENLYYMGYWCLEKKNQSFQNLDDFKIINCKERNDKEIKEDLSEINNLYFALIDDFTILLNKLHKKNFSKKFWEILIGPWTKLFLGIVHERYISIKKVLTVKEIEKIILVDYTKSDLASNNVNDLTDKASNDINQWNTVLYTILYEFLNDSNPHKIEKLKIIKKKNIQKKNKKNLKYFVISFLNKLNNFNLVKRDFFIYQFDLRLKDLLYLFFSLKQFPTILSENYCIKKEINIKLREKLNFEKENISEYESFVRENLKYFLPTDIIENFDYLISEMEKKNWPKNPKYIFTSFGYHGNEIFQIYLATKTEKKAKYILHQHGSNYFTGKNTIVDSGFYNCDRFISWGNPKNKKCISFFNTKNLDIDIDNKIGEKILFFGPKMSPNRKRPFDEYGKIIRDSIFLEKIMNSVNDNLKKKSVLKLYNLGEQSRYLEEKILKEIIFKNNKFDIKRSRINQELIDDSRILIHIGDGTAFLESLAIKKPTVCFLENLNWIRDEVRKDYEELIEAKIIFTKDVELSNHINKVYSNIEKWWHDKNVEMARNKFCEKYSKTAPQKGINEISKLMEEIINGRYN